MKESDLTLYISEDGGLTPEATVKESLTVQAEDLREIEQLEEQLIETQGKPHE